MSRFLLVLILLVAARTADACTTIAFRVGDRPMLAYNFDFAIGQGLVVVNKRGVAKSSEYEANGARWTSRYGSITFVQFGRDNPMTGMNEAGLMVSQMWLDEARYEPADGRPRIGVLEWLQYLLDTSATMEEALARGAEMRVESRVPLHYELADASGDAAVVEFLDGERVVRRGETLAHSVLTNDPYQQAVEHMSAMDPATMPAGSGSLQRFARAASLAERGDADPVAHAFAALAVVAQPGFTRWSVVLDPADRTARWRTDVNTEIRVADLRAFDLSCASPVKVFGIHEGGGDVASAFRDFSRTEHDGLVTSSYAMTPFLAPLGEAAALAAAHHPETAVCHE